MADGPAPIVCILSSPRTGSTALRNALARTGRTTDLGEIFHTETRFTAGSFLEFIQQQPDPLRAMVAPGPIIGAYIEHLVAKAAGRIPLLDIKHNTWTMLRPAWTYPHEEPSFLRALKERNARFLFLRRRSIGDQIVSEVLARETGKWGGGIGRVDLDRVGTITIPIAGVARHAALISRSEALIAEFVAAYPHKMFIAYEDLFVDSAISADIWDGIAALTGIDGPPPRTEVKQNDRTGRDAIANYREVVEAAAAAALPYRTADLA